MYVEFDKKSEGHKLVLGKKDEIMYICVSCGRKISQVPFYLCERTKNIICKDCELIRVEPKNTNINKCKVIGDNHSHFKIIGISGNTQLNNTGGNTNGTNRTR